MKLVAVGSESELRTLDKDHARLAGEAIVTTGNLVVAAALEAEGRTFVDEWSTLSADQLDSSLIEAHRLSEAWWQGLVGPEVDVTAAGLNLVNVELAYPFEICLNAMRVYETIFDRYAIEGVSGFFRPVIPMVRNGPSPLFAAAAGLSQSILKWMAAKRGITVESLVPPSPEMFTAPTVSRTYAVQPVWEFDSARPRVLILDNSWLSRDEVDVLESTFTDTGWLALRIGGFGRPTSSRHRDADDVRRLRAAHRSFGSSPAIYGGSHPEIFANSYLTPQFDAIFEELEAALLLKREFGNLLNIVRPSAVVMGYEAFARERSMVSAARERGIPVASVVHGSLTHAMDAHGLVGDADVVLTGGPQDSQRILDAGIDRTRVHAVGSLRYNRHRLSTRDSPARKRSPSKILLLTASVNSGNCEVVAEGTGHRSTWRGIYALAARRLDLSFEHKPHPTYDHYAFYEHLQRSPHAKVRYLQRSTLRSALERAGVVVLVNYCTGAALEAILAGVPVVYLRADVYRSPLRADPLMDFVLVAESVSELEKILDGLMEPRAVEAAIARQQAVLDGFVDSDDPREAAARTSAMLKDIASPMEGDSHPLFEAARSLLREDFTTESCLRFTQEIDRVDSDQAEGVVLGLAMVIGLSSKNVRDTRRKMKRLLTVLPLELRRSLRYDATVEAFAALVATQMGWRAIVSGAVGVGASHFHALGNSRYVRSVGRSLLGGSVGVRASSAMRRKRAD
jgi:hypothetical protein